MSESKDDDVAWKNIRLTKSRLTGAVHVHYGCPHCGEALNSAIEEIGLTDSCPSCHRDFVVPGKEQYRHFQKQQQEEEAELAKKKALQEIEQRNRKQKAVAIKRQRAKRLQLASQTAMASVSSTVSGSTRSNRVAVDTVLNLSFAVGKQIAAGVLFLLLLALALQVFQFASSTVSLTFEDFTPSKDDIPVAATLALIIDAEDEHVQVEREREPDPLQKFCDKHKFEYSTRAGLVSVRRSHPELIEDLMDTIESAIEDKDNVLPENTDIPERVACNLIAAWFIDGLMENIQAKQDAMTDLEMRRSESIAALVMIAGAVSVAIVVPLIIRIEYYVRQAVRNQEQGEGS